MSSTSPEQGNDSGSAGGDSTARLAENSTSIPRQKRLACLICRRRKLKCDGHRPSCSTCTRLGHACAYDEVRRKSGPKRGYVKALEERLKQVEVMLKSQDGAHPASGGDSLSFSTTDGTSMTGLGPSASSAQNNGGISSGIDAARNDISNPTIDLPVGNHIGPWQYHTDSPPPRTDSLNDFDFGSRMTPVMGDIGDMGGVGGVGGVSGVGGVGSSMNWELIQLNLEEPLPDPAAIAELQQIYFSKIHPSLPMVHKARFLAAMNLSANQRPPVCLRYAMWTMACTVTDKYNAMKEIFYQRARKYIELDTMKGFGEHMLSVAHCQTYIILASYEFKMMYFPRAWMTTGQAVRLCQMIGLHRQDGHGLDVKQCIPPAQDWTEREERRRTFWMAFCEDRYASIGTGWPMTIDERDITSHLPSTEEAFEMNRSEETVSLQDLMRPAGIAKLTPFGGIILMAYMFGRNLTHLHRPDVDRRDDDLNGEFWKRHRNLDSILLNTILGLPSQLKLPSGLENPNVVFTNMCLQTSIICLHQAAIYKAEKHNLEDSVCPESKIRCTNAASETASIMRMVSHTDLSAMNPFVSFSLYVASRVFVQFLKDSPDESVAADSLRFLLTAMAALKQRNPLTESFLVQLDVDLEALGERIPRLKGAFPRSYESPIPGPSVSLSNRTGAVCNDGAVDGILSYQKEFSKPNNDKVAGSAAASEDSSAQDSFSGRSGSPLVVGRVNSGGLVDSDPWYPRDNTQTAQAGDRGGVDHSPFYNMAVMFGGHTGDSLLTGRRQTTMGYVDEIQDVSTSPGDVLSNRPTPNSSSASESRQNLAPPQQQQQQQGSQTQSSDRGSFDTSPVPADVLSSSGGSGDGAGQQGTRGNNGSTTTGATFFAPGTGVSSGSGAAATAVGMDGTAGLGSMMGATPSSNEYVMAQGWPMPGQAMTQVSDEGVLRTIIQMGPMETMDLGWGANT